MIRRAEGSDIADVAALYHAIWHETHAAWMPAAEIERRRLEFFVDRMNALSESILVTEHNGTIAAFSAWRDTLLGQFFVAAGHRGTLMASRLLTATEVEMARLGVTDAELYCVAANGRALRFYQRMGWRMTERVSGEGTATGVPFWRMTKALSG